jgi:hypothetical protein
MLLEWRATSLPPSGCWRASRRHRGHREPRRLHRNQEERTSRTVLLKLLGMGRRQAAHRQLRALQIGRNQPRAPGDHASTWSAYPHLSPGLPGPLRVPPFFERAAKRSTTCREAFFEKDCPWPSASALASSCSIGFTRTSSTASSRAALGRDTANCNHADYLPLPERMATRSVNVREAALYAIIARIQDHQYIRAARSIAPRPRFPSRRGVESIWGTPRAAASARCAPRRGRQRGVSSWWATRRSSSRRR